MLEDSTLVYLNHGASLVIFTFVSVAILYCRIRDGVVLKASLIFVAIPSFANMLHPTYQAQTFMLLGVVIAALIAVAQRALLQHHFWDRRDHAGGHLWKFGLLERRKQRSAH